MYFLPGPFLHFVSRLSPLVREANLSLSLCSRAFLSSHRVRNEAVLSQVAPHLSKSILRPPATITKTKSLEGRNFFDTNVTTNLNLQHSLMSKNIKQEHRLLVLSTLDKNGKVLNRSVSASKSNLCNWHSLLIRDLRKLDCNLKNQLPAVLIRNNCILVNLYLIKAIIKYDRVILFENTYDLQERKLQLEFFEELKGLIIGSLSPIDTCVGESDETAVQQSKKLPFELRVFEFMLQKACSQLQDQLDILGPKIDASLYHLERFIHWEKLEILLACKKSMNEFHRTLQGLKNCIDELLNDDADMEDMYLTKAKLSQKKAAAIHSQQVVNIAPEVIEDGNHDEVELLLESYLLIAEEMDARVSYLLKNIESTEDIVNIGLISQRNNLLLLELKLSIGTFAIATGGLGASFFGMNLTSGLEHSPDAFWGITAVLGSLASFAFFTGWQRMSRLIRKS